ncbi:MAG: hypothetical protein IT428_32340 [Planctomycetaceae bacterium]|nr:hypothetical protein [Planctomycetaceae bacterium]
MTVSLISGTRGKALSRVSPDAAGAPASDMISIRPEELIVGRALQNDVVSDSEHLLLAAGTQVTPRFFDLLNQHKVTTLQIHRADAEHATLRDLTTEPMPAGVPFDSELTRKLDTLIDAGSLFVANVGPTRPRKHGVAWLQSLRPRAGTGPFRETDSAFESPEWCE